MGRRGWSKLTFLVRPDEGLQRAFGREACAEQSVVQETLDACDSENVTQMEQAMDEIYRSLLSRVSAQLPAGITDFRCRHEWAAMRTESGLCYQRLFCDRSETVGDDN